MKSTRVQSEDIYRIRDPGLERARAALAEELEWRRHLWTPAVTDGHRPAEHGAASPIAASRRRLDTLLCAVRLRLRDVQARIRHRARRRAAIRELERLPDRLLADVGVPRHRIVEFVDGSLAKTQQTPARPTVAAPAEPRAPVTASRATRAAA